MTVQIRDSDGTVRLSGDLLAAAGATGDVLTQQADGTYTPAPGGGSQPVTCVLARDSSTDVHAVGDHPILWDGLYDNYAEFNSLLAIPAGLGLDFDFDGSASTITTTEEGVWTFTFLAFAVTDNNWKGAWSMGLSPFLVQMDASIGIQIFQAATFALPSGQALTQKIVTAAPADDAGFGITNAYVFLTRHG